MSRPSTFDLAATPLGTGITLVEASAGTGKTYCITGIVLRLLLEGRVENIRQILAMTYTRAAAKELRDRIWGRLGQAARLLKGGPAAKADSLPEVERFLHQNSLEKIEEGRARLDQALRDFDEASIFTIHGFCQRMLLEHAFESGIAFDVELLEDLEPLYAEIAADYWRNTFYRCGPLIAALAYSESLFPASLARLIQERSVQHAARIDLGGTPEDRTAATLSQELAEQFQRLEKIWRRTGVPPAVEDLVARAKIGRGTRSLGPAEKRALLNDLRRLEEPDPTIPLLDALEAVRSSGLKSSKTCPNPDHAFFRECETFAELRRRFFNRLRKEFLDYADEELVTRKTRGNVQTFDDLLTRLDDSLQGKGGARLVEAIRGRFRAALIDEFQDTDPLQYRIMHRLFDSKAHYLFFIGDPKQAIYSFRGADVFTYLDAREDAGREFTLTRNWRSEERLIGAVNTLFGSTADPFRRPEIAFPPAEPGRRGDEENLTIGGAVPPSPLQLICVGTDGNAGETRERIEADVVTRIHELLAGKVRLGGKKLGTADIAVLVRTNRQADSLKKRLAEHGVPAVLHVDASVFKTEEARELALFLKAVLEPSRPALARAALVTRLLGFKGDAVVALEQDEARSRAWQEKLWRCHEEWNRNGFIGMFRGFLEEEQVRPRLLGLRHGERILTNFLHLSELLHEAEIGHRLGPSDLFHWLDEQRHGEGATAEEHQLRLEKDDEAVRLVTVHKSKGLEYPVVFCPFSWEPVSDRFLRILYHDDRRRAVLDLSDAPSDEHLRAARAEALEERLRQLYVAVTRARNRCHLYFRTLDEAPSDSPMGHLLGGGSAGWRANVKRLIAQSRQAIELVELETAPAVERARPAPGDRAEAAVLQAREFTRSLPRSLFIASFTGMASGLPEEHPDRDIEAAPGAIEADRIPSATPEGSLFDFPRGVKAGDFFHEMLEDADFQDPKAMTERIRQKLEAFGLDADRHAASVQAGLERLFRHPLTGANGGFSLSEVPARERLAEVEFYYPLRPTTAADLGRIFAEHGHPETAGSFAGELERLSFRPAEGFLKGFMDLVFRHGERFYLVDWKSNWLGDRFEDYDPAPVRKAMEAHRYFLQYHLYLVALNLYLRTRLEGYDYEKHFGGVFYIFLRGIDPAHPARGVFHDRPPQALIQALQKLLTAR